MIDLDRLERLAALALNQSGEGEWLPYEETWHELAVSVAALIRAARAAMEYEVWSDAVSISQAFDARDEFEAALAPFRGSEDT